MTASALEDDPKESAHVHSQLCRTKVKVPFLYPKRHKRLLRFARTCCDTGDHFG